MTRKKGKKKQKKSDFFLNSHVDESLIWLAVEKISTNKFNKIITESQEELSCLKE